VADDRGTEDERVRVALLGFGRVGQATLDLATTRPWIDVACVIAKDPANHGTPVTASVSSAPAGLTVRTDAAAALSAAAAKVVIMATTSRLPAVLEHLRTIAGTGAQAVISTSEELAYIEPDDSPEAAAIHDLAREADLRIVATGVNPGFVLDLWPLALSGLAWDVERIEARRVVDVSVFAPHTRSQLGIGHAPAAFEAGVADGSIAWHLGFRESLRLLCAAMGAPAERVTIETLPVIAERDYEIADGTIATGSTVGASQRAVAWRDGAAWISIELLLHVAPDQDDIRTIDESHIFGRHELHATLDPGAGAILSTAAQLINTIPVALQASPGLYGPGQLRPSAPWLASTAPAWQSGPAVTAA
jgi:hypothetical protein